MIEMKSRSCSCPLNMKRRDHIDFTGWFRGELIHIREVPAEICTRCGKSWLWLRTCVRIERILRARPRVGRRVRARIAKYGARR
jgi:YgiT-type zinc finger domain-containing protein